MCQEQAVARLRHALGTLVAVEARGPRVEVAERAVDAAYAAINYVEWLLHPTRRGSELASLNRLGPGARRRVHPWTAALLRLSRDLCAHSGGIFDPALPGQGSIMNWEPDRLHGVYVRRRAFVDLGGVAKGYAVDQAVTAMRRAGAHAGLVNAGGDLRVYGAMHWLMSVRDQAGGLRGVPLRDLALACSADGAGSDSGSRPQEHQGYYRRGERARRAPPRAASVIAPSAALADALTKVQMYAAPARAAALLARYRARALGAG
jgi:thiamine biosynthesis lipoprotein